MNNSALASTILQRFASEKTAEQLASYFQARVLSDGGTYEANQCLVDNIKRIQNIGLLNRVVLAVFANAKKTSKLYSVIPSDGTGDLSFIRLSTRTIINSAGAMETIAANLPPIEYSEGGTCPTLSLDNARLNYFVNSDVLATQNVTISGITTHTISFWGTGTITLSGAHVGQLVGESDTDRVTLSFTPSEGTLTCTVSGSVIKAQLERNGYASSYMPSGASTFSRDDDSCSLSNLDNILSENKGTMFCDIAVGVDFPATAGVMVGVGDIQIWGQITSPNRWAIYSDAGGDGAGLTTDKSRRYRIAVSFNGPNVTSYANGVLLASHSARSAAKPTSVTIRGTQGSIKLHVPMILFNTDLQPSEMARLTTI